MNGHASSLVPKAILRLQTASEREAQRVVMDDQLRQLTHVVNLQTAALRTADARLLALETQMLNLLARWDARPRWRQWLGR